MKTLTLLIATGLLLLSGVAQALTVDEIIRLKRAGVSDSTIEMLIKGDGDSRSAGTWKTKDGWIVHTTETRERQNYSDDRYYGNEYPIAVYPNVDFRRR
jgi:hypothetical protein